MPVALVDALEEMLSGWQSDLPEPWRAILGEVELGFDACDPGLELEFWEPIFPPRKGVTFPGAPDGAHILRAFDGLAPGDVKVLVLGQDPYPAPDFSTGRAFECGSAATWRELDKMFSRSVRAYMQLVCAVRTGKADYAAGFDRWPTLLADIETGVVDLEAPGAIADRWVAEGVLLLNSSLTLSRFQVQPDPHQTRGHMPVWRPLMHAVLNYLAASGRPVVILSFGDTAEGCIATSGIEVADSSLHVIQRPHPAFADDLLALANPFIACNEALAARGVDPVAW